MPPLRTLLLWLAPARWRDAIEGDLEESARRRDSRFLHGFWILGHLAVIVVRLRLESIARRLPAPVPPGLRGWPGHAWQDARYGVRRWASRPAFAAVAVLTVALGIGTTSALFSVVDGVLLKPLPYPHPDRLVAINRTYPDWQKDPILAAGWNRISLAWPEFFHVRDRSRTIDSLAVVSTRLALVDSNPTQELRVGVASASFFQVLGVTPALGGLFSPDDDVRDPGTLLISHSVWKTRFGADPAIIGRSIPIRRGSRIVAGVLPEGFSWGTRQLPYHFWYPLSAIPENERADNNRYLEAIARLRPGVGLADASAEMSALLRETFRYASVTGGVATPLLERQLQRVRTPLMLLLTGAILLLVIACANVAGLLTGDAAGRESEMALRASLGATSGRLLRMLLVEGLILSVVGATAGLLIASWVVRMLITLAPADMPRVAEIAVDRRVVALATVAAVGTALLFASIPALALRWTRRGSGEAGATRSVTARRRATGGLALIEIALGVALLAGAGLFARSLHHLEQVDSGFDRGNLLTLRAGLPPSPVTDDGRASRYFDAVQRVVAALPGVESVAVSSNVPFAAGRTSTTITLLDAPAGEAPQFEAQRRFVSTDYFDTLRIPLVRGRTFDASDTRTSAPVAIVSRDMERRLWPGGAVGRTFNYAKADHLVVGVVQDIREQALGGVPRATFYLSTGQRPVWSTMRVIVRTAVAPATLAAAVREAIVRLDPSVPVEDVTTMDDIVYRATDDERYRAVLMGVFAVAASVLAAIGLYSTLSRRVLDRRREIGVRMALGARPAQVRRLFLAEGLRMGLGGIALGIPLALLLGRAARSLLFGISPADPATLGAVVLAVGTLTVLGTYLPSVRASRVDPITVLRSE